MVEVRRKKNKYTTIILMLLRIYSIRVRIIDTDNNIFDLNMLSFNKIIRIKIVYNYYGFLS